MMNPVLRCHRLRTGFIAFVLCIALAVPGKVFAAGYDAIPKIPALESADPVFSQYSDDVSEARIALATEKIGDKPPLHLYTYTVKKGEDLLNIAARCSVPYEAIATLNRIASMQDSIEGKTILLPTLPGLYLPEKAENTIEHFVLSSFDPDDKKLITFHLGDAVWHCIPGGVFDGTTRAFFVTPSFRFPLPGLVVTSSFGMRKNPVTGHMIFHKGIDLAAPQGTPVHPCADGVVTYTGYDPIYGNHIIIKHDGNRESLYGHLSSIKIELHQKVKTDTIIGTVGSTGQSTGPHLHFEIHENGVPKNPAGMLKGKKGL